MRGSMLCLAISLFIPFTGSTLAAQAGESPPNLGWLTFGLGAVIEGRDPPMTVGAEASFQNGVHLFSGRGLYVVEPLGTATEAWEAAVLYGRTHRGRHHQAAISGGLALLGCQGHSVCGDYDTPDWEADKDFETTAGLALSGQFFWTPGGLFGIGMYGFANVNTRGFFGGAMLGLRFGKLR